MSLPWRRSRARWSTAGTTCASTRAHGGWGGTLAGLAQGVPLVIAGGDLDKPEVAARVAWSGAGVNLHTGTPTAAAAQAGVDCVLADASCRDAAARVAAQLQALGGAARAAELLEREV